MFGKRLPCLVMAAGLAIALAPVPLAAARGTQAAAAATATCSRTWVGNESAIEEFLRTAKVAQLEEVPIGVTKPQRAVFEPGGLVRRAAWKPLLPSYKGGFHESYKAEVAAYVLDRLLELQMVPPVVQRSVSRIDGAMVYWIENTHPWDVKNPPVGPGPEWAHQVSRMRLFDWLIANIDRNAGNLLYDDDWHLFLIDHSRAFIDRKDLKGVTAPARVDREFWNRIEALTPDQLQQTLGPWLTKNELAALLVRRDKMREEIAKMVAARGESSVFF